LDEEFKVLSEELILISYFRFDLKVYLNFIYWFQAVILKNSLILRVHKNIVPVRLVLIFFYNNRSLDVSDLKAVEETHLFWIPVIVISTPVLEIGGYVTFDCFNI
jgi:hypothetical protein